MSRKDVVREDVEMVHREDERLRADADAALDAAGPERHYQALGRWKGPLAYRAVQEAARSFWRHCGDAGARWLVRRLRDEHDVEAMHAAASTLAALGAACLGPILDELGRGGSADRAQVLLWALVSRAESDPALRLDGPRAELVLSNYLHHDEPDLRESAAEAMRLLGPERAARRLSRRLRDEPSAEVRRTIEAELVRCRAGRP